MPKPPEFVVVGQGLAGTALAWALLRRGRRVLVIDRETGGSSRRAAGLITSVTGKRLAKSWRWDELFPVAAAFYRAREADTGEAFFRERPALRLFTTEAERADFARKSEVAFRGLVRPAEYFGEAFDGPLGGFELDAARLDVPAYLDASRRHFQARGAYLAADVAPGGVDANAEGVRIPALGVEAGTLAFCRGFAPDPDPWFGRVRFRAAKGEILSVRVPGLGEERVIHRGVWLAPLGGDLFRVGATYSWHQLDSQPTPEGRAEIEGKLREFLRVPFEVVEHHAAVRPIIGGSVPVLGTHPNCPRVAFFNGLGSKGSLLSPFFAEQLTAHLCDGTPIDPDVDVRARL